MIEATLLLLGAAAVTAASSGGTDIPYFGPGVTVLGTVSALYMLYRFQRAIVVPLEHRASSTDQRLTRETRRADTCEWRFQRLGEWLRGEGHAVPDEILYGKPPWVKDDSDDG